MNGLHPERLVVVRNPYSRQAQRTDSMMGDLHDAVPHIPIETIESQRRLIDHKDALASTVREGDYLFVAGGDGTAGATLCAMSDSAMRDHGRRIPIGILPCGTKNDLYHTFSGGKFKRPRDILLNGYPLGLTTLKAEIDTGETRHEFRAAAYIGINATAYGAELAMSSTIRRSRAPGFIRDLRVALHMLRTKPITIEGYPKHGNPRDILDMTVPNIPRMAGRPLFKEMRPHDTGLHSYTLPAEIGMARGFARSLRGRLPQRTHSSGTLTFTVNHDTLLQVDGETVQNDIRAAVPAGSRITIDRLSNDDACSPLVALPHNYNGHYWPGQEVLNHIE